MTVLEAAGRGRWTPTAFLGVFDPISALAADPSAAGTVYAAATLGDTLAVERRTARGQSEKVGTLVLPGRGTMIPSTPKGAVAPSTRTLTAHNFVSAVITGLVSPPMNPSLSLPFVRGATGAE